MRRRARRWRTRPAAPSGRRARLRSAHVSAHCAARLTCSHATTHMLARRRSSAPPRARAYPCKRCSCTLTEGANSAYPAGHRGRSCRSYTCRPQCPFNVAGRARRRKRVSRSRASEARAHCQRKAWRCPRLRAPELARSACSRSTCRACYSTHHTHGLGFSRVAEQLNRGRSGGSALGTKKHDDNCTSTGRTIQSHLVPHVLYCDARDRRHVLHNPCTASNGVYGEVQSTHIHMQCNIGESVKRASVPAQTRQRPAWQARGAMSGRA